uniref:Protein piccolo n=1 Tax=Cacopsylla melanoneura TaxID=428564 RepID=A0A8D8LYU8_9HEMI
MLPTNVMSFMKKMVTNEQVGPGGTDQGDSGTTLSKLRQTLSSSLNAAQDKVTKLNTATSRQCDIVTSLSETTLQDSSNTTAPIQNTITPPKGETGKQPGRLGNCRVCLKSFKPDDYSRVCYECHQKVCEDCASYSKLDENQDENTWRCSICRRKLQSRAQPVLSQNSTDSLLDVPVLEALQRRHSDVKIGSANSGAHPANQGLAPPRSPELRRHSDVSPASLKELEKAVLKVKSEQRGGGGLDWNQNNNSTSNNNNTNSNNNHSSHRKSSGSPGSTRVPSPSVEKRSENNNWDSRLKPGHLDADVEGDEHDDSEHKIRRGSKAGTTRRRKSRAVVTKQHSYDDEIKTNSQAQSATNPQAPPSSHELSLGSSVQFSRRASAYDVFNRDSSNPIMPPAQGRRASCRQPTTQDTDDPSLLKSSIISDPSGPTLGSGLDEERRTRRRGSQLPDIAAIKAGLHQQRAGDSILPRASISNIAPPRLGGTTDDQPPVVVAPPVLRQPSVTAGEDIKIVIHDVDYDSSFNNRQVSKRRVVLRRDVSDMAHRTRGFGMRVVGGKMGPDGRLFAYIVWTVPGGPAEKGGLQQGDKVLEWCGVGLTDRSFEEVCSIMDRTGDVAELLVEHGADLRMCDLLDEPMPGSARKNSGDALGLQLVEADGSPASPTRRKLPKTPEQLAKERQVSGRIQLQVYYNDEKNEIVVSVLAADDLATRDESCGYGNLPEAYVQLRLLPFTGDMNCMKTEIAEPATNPIWNKTVDVANVSGDQLLDKTIEVTLWDSKPDKEQVFLGETTIELQKALIDDRPVWYRLEDPRQLRGGGGANKSPRGSIQGDANNRGLQKRDTNRSMSEDRESEADLGEGLSLLHPDHAYLSGSRRGSSQSEQLEVETYQLNKDFSRSLPGSRRSSLLSGQEKNETADPDIPPATYSKSRRRSSCTPRQDPDEILRNLKAVKGELMSQKGRSMSICAESTKRLLRRGSTRKGRKESCIELSSNAPPIIAGASKHSPLDEDEDYTSLVKLGPGQIQPRGYRLVPGGYIELKIGLILTKGQLEVEVISARGIPPSDPQPDTYVKTYLRDRDNDRWIQKRKTRVVRNSTEPAYKQTLKYNGNELSDRSLLVMLWERQKGFEHNQGMGGAEIALNSVVNSKVNSTLSVGWYPLFPIHTLGSDSNDSP